MILQGGPWYDAVDGLRYGLKELGIEEGKQIVLDIRDAKGDVKAVEEAAKSLEREKVKLIYALATSVVTPVKRATKEIPIVFNVGSDPVGTGLVESFAKPGGRLTGIHFVSRDLTAKRLEILNEMLPKLRAVVTFYNPANPVAIEAARNFRRLRRLGYQKACKRNDVTERVTHDAGANCVTKSKPVRRFHAQGPSDRAHDVTNGRHGNHQHKTGAQPAVAFEKRLESAGLEAELRDGPAPSRDLLRAAIGRVDLPDKLDALVQGGRRLGEPVDRRSVCLADSRAWERGIERQPGAALVQFDPVMIADEGNEFGIRGRVVRQVRGFQNA